MDIKIIRTSTISMSLNILLKGQLKFLNKHFEVVGIASSGEDLASVEKREDIKTIAIDMKRGISPLKDLSALIQLYQQFKSEKPTIVHSITPKAGLLSMLAGKMARVPIRMHTFTGLIFPNKTGLMQKLLIKMDQLLCWASTNIYPEGNGVKNDLINYRITSKPLKVLANGNVNGIDLVFFSEDIITEERQVNLREKLNIDSNDFVFIFVGRLVGDKGINELVEAFRGLGDRFEGLGARGEGLGVRNQGLGIRSGEVRDKSEENTGVPKLLLVGSFESELDPLLPDILQEIENNPHIISVGYQQDVRPYFAISDALVFPSYREGFPNVVMQAGAMGLPSIVSDINGCNEIIIEGQNGSIVPPKNIEKLMEAMRKILNDKGYYNQLQRNARKMIETRYEQRVVWEALLEEYRRLLREIGE